MAGNTACKHMQGCTYEHAPARATLRSICCSWNSTLYSSSCCLTTCEGKQRQAEVQTSQRLAISCTATYSPQPQWLTCHPTTNQLLVHTPDAQPPSLT